MANISKFKTFTDGAVPTANDFNQDFDTIYNEFNGNIDNSNIKANAAIVGTKLATNAVTKLNTATRDKTNFVVSSTSFVDVTNLSVTLTAQSGSDVLVFVTLGIVSHNTAGGRVAFTLNIDGVDVGSPSDCLAHVGGSSSPANVWVPVNFHHYISAISSGSHTIKVRSAVNTGTADIGGSVGQNRITVLELKR